MAQWGNMVIMRWWNHNLWWNVVVVQGGNIVVAWLNRCGMEAHTLHSFLLPVIANLSHHF